MKEKLWFLLIFLPFFALFYLFSPNEKIIHEETTITTTSMQTFSSINLNSVSATFTSFDAERNLVTWTATFTNQRYLRITGIDFVLTFYSSTENVSADVPMGYTLNLPPRKTVIFRFSAGYIDKKYDSLLIRPQNLPVYSYASFFDTYKIWIIVVLATFGSILLIYSIVAAVNELDVQDTFEWIGEKWGYVLGSLGPLVFAAIILIWKLITLNFILMLMPVILVASIFLAFLLGACFSIFWEWCADEISWLKIRRRNRDVFRALNANDDLNEFSTNRLKDFAYDLNIKLKRNNSKAEIVKTILAWNDAPVYEDDADETSSFTLEPDNTDEDFSFEPVKKSKQKKTESKSKAISEIKLADIAGLEAAKNSIEEKIILPLKHKELFQKYDKKTGGGILLYGPPGTGKTMFAEAISNELDATFFSIKGSDVKSKWFGESENKIKILFSQARKSKLSVIFFDEFEAIGKKRNSNDSSEDVVPEILAQIQGLGTKNNNTLLIIGATNRPWDIDSALLRPGRFDEKIYIPLPDFEARAKIFELKLKNIESDGTIDYKILAYITEGFNGSDINEFCEKLKIQLIKRAIKLKTEVLLGIADVEIVAKTMRSSVVKEDIKAFEEYNNSNL